MKFVLIRGCKILGYLTLIGLIYLLYFSLLDFYNNFAYDKAILKDSPYGFTPMLKDPKDMSSVNQTVKSGDYVYVVDWLSAYNSKVVFAKVKFGLKEGYINKDLLVEANFNVLPILSALILFAMLLLTVRKAYKRFAV